VATVLAVILLACLASSGAQAPAQAAAYSEAPDTTAAPQAAPGAQAPAAQPAAQPAVPAAAIQAGSSPLVTFAAIEEAWNKGWADSISAFFPEAKIALRLEKNSPESANFTQKQASYMLRDSFRYKVTDYFKFQEFKYKKDGKKPPLGKAHWAFRTEPAGKSIVAKVEITLRKDGERWVISGIKIQD